MLLLSIEFSNFRQYKNQKIYFPQNGLIGIVGHNGAGKSTLFNAIGWALYGKIKNVTQSMIKNQSASKKDDCYVILDFIFQKNHFRVKRDLNSSKSYVQIDGIIKATGTTSINELIEKDIFKMDHSAFCTCYYAEQDDFDALVKLNPGPRVATLSKLLRIETIDKAAEQARKEFRTLELEVNEAKKYTKNEDELTSERKEATDLKNTFEIKKQSLEKELETLSNKYKDLLVEKNEGEETYRIYQTLLNDKKHFSSQIETLNTHTILPNTTRLDKLVLLQKNYDKSSHVITEYKDLQKEERHLLEEKNKFLEKQRIEKEIDSLKAEVKSYSDEVKSLNEELSIYSQVEENITNKQKEISTLENLIAAISDSIKELSVTANLKKEKYTELKNEKESFSNLGTGVPCPTCFQDLTEEHIHAELERRKVQMDNFIDECKKLQEKANKLVEKRKSAKGKLADMKSELASLQKQIVEKNKISERFKILTSEVMKRKDRYKKLTTSLEKVKDVNFEESHYSEVISSIEKLSKKYEQLVKSEELLKEIEPLKKSLSETKKTIAQHRLKIDSIEEKLEQIKFDEYSYNNLSEQINLLNSSINHLKENKNEVDSEMKVLQLKIDNINQTIEENKDILSSIKKKEKEMVILSKLDEVYKGYKTDRLNKLSPALSAIMSEYIKDITNDKYTQIELDDKYNIFIYRNGVKNPLEFYSGGEKKLAALCQRLAISELIVSQTGQLKFDMLAMDEVLGAMDNERQDSIMDMLRNLNDTFSQILIVAHNDHAKELFDHILEIKQDKDGFSYVTWATVWDEEEVSEIANEFDFEEEAE